MKKLVALIAALLLGSLALAGCSSSGGSVQTVDAATWMTQSQQPGVVIVDVRTAGEYAQAHVDGATNIDVEAPTFDAEIAKLDKNATYVVYCHSGRRSGIATQKMADAGFAHVVNLDGGIADLQSAGATIVAS